MEEFKFKDSEGKEIFVYKWVPKNKSVKGVIQIAHGMTETSLRYNYFAERLNEEGYVVYANDHRGHGKTSGGINNLGYIADSDGFHWMVDDLNQLTNIIREEYKNTPIILFGHSMGSFLSQRYAEIYGNGIEGLILSGTNGKPKKITKLGGIIAKLEINIYGRKHISKLMDKLSFGDFNKKFRPNRTPYDWLCSVEEEVDKYIEDEYCGFICTSSFYYDLIRGLWTIHQENNLKEIPKDLPVYIFAGDRDPVGDCGDGIINLFNSYNNIGIKDVKYKLYKDGRHEMLNEKNKDEVISDVVVWIEEKLKKKII